MSELFEYKCPNCGGALRFDSTVQQLKCPYCDSTVDVAALSGYDEELRRSQPDQINWEQTAGNQWEAGETDRFKVYVCNSCGGEIIADENTAASKCPYCDNPVVMKGITGLGGVIDLNMERNEDGTNGFIGAEFSTKMEKSLLTALNYGYVSPKQATTDIYASADMDDYSRHGDTDFSQNVSFNLTHRFTPRNRMQFYLRQSYGRNKEFPLAFEGRDYTAFLYYYHTLNRIGTELLGVAGYNYIPL